MSQGSFASDCADRRYDPIGQAPVSGLYTCSALIDRPHPSRTLNRWQVLSVGTLVGRDVNGGDPMTPIR
jgi:hypothetical protein